MKKIISIILIICLIGIVTIPFYAISKNINKGDDKMNTIQSETQNLIENYKEASCRDLAILINNKDFSNETIEKILQAHGYRDYITGCETLVRMGYLIYIPEYEMDGIKYPSSYNTPNSIAVANARERGII